MNPAKLGGLILVVGGVAALAYGSITYTSETHDAKLGPIELSVKEKKTVNVPVWTGVVAVVVGVGLVLASGRKAGA